VEACPGAFENPEAAIAGVLCVYPGLEVGFLRAPSETANQSWLEGGNEFGVSLPFNIQEENTSIRGSWAVRG
jgi:hypothetical protein